MKKNYILLAGVAMTAALASCNMIENDKNGVLESDMSSDVISVMSGVETKGYVDGTTFYEKATETMHTSAASTARTMKLSAYRTPEAGQTAAPGNYFVGEEFAENAGVWKHNPPYYWPLASTLDFLAYSSTQPFAAKDAKWNSSNASSSVVLTFDSSRCQDDVLFGAQTKASKDATSIAGSVYTTGQSVNMEFKHSQAWIEFQLSVADASMTDKIAIKEIILKDAVDNGTLTVTRGVESEKTVANGEWALGTSKDIKFADNYNVYGYSKKAEEFTSELQAIKDAEAALEAAEQSGNAAAVETAEANLQSAKDAYSLAVSKYPLTNALNAVGPKGASGTPSDSAEIKTDCAFLDMLLPQQPKADIVIKYVLAGRPNVFEYKYNLRSSSNNWEMGKKYIYDIDFVISEITVNPSVKAYEASFDGTDLKPVELL